MNKLIIMIVIFMSLICGSCSTPMQKAKTLRDEALVKQIESGAVSYPQITITDKTSYLITPLIVGVFASIILIFSGIRAIGIGVLTASVACLILIFSLSLYMKWIALGGILVLLVGLFYVFKMIYDQHSTNKDMYSSMELAKTFGPAKRPK